MQVIYFPLILTAKSVELDERIPFISKLKRYSGLVNRTEEFTKAEQAFIKAFDWNLQCCTLVDQIELYLAMGIVNSHDNYSEDIVEDNTLKEKVNNFEVNDSCLILRK